MQRKIFSRQRGPECKCTRKETWRSRLYNFYRCYRKVDCNCKLFHDGGPYHIDWTGFYVIRISVMKGEKDQHSRFVKSLWYAVWDTFSIFKCAKRNYIYQAQLSEDLLLNEKAWNHIGNQKKDHISPGY